MKHVYNYNAIAVIVYNDRDSQNLDKMQLLDKERKWPPQYSYLARVVVGQVGF